MAWADFTEFLNLAISYVKKWLIFSEDKWLFSLQPLSLDNGTLTPSDIEKVASKLNFINTIKMDDLCDECTTAILNFTLFHSISQYFILLCSVLKLF